MLMEGQLPLITAADIARADESRVRLAVGAGDLRPIADDRDVVGELERVAVRHREVAPTIAGSGRGRDVLGRMDAVHLARLWESEQAASVQMRGEMIGAGEPEALLDREELVLNGHIASRC